uniref:Uncharacterized protein n=1 Tax=Schizaphis graminum TaxID=13262 RepID=A0A2S2N7W0_SCHGA
MRRKSRHKYIAVQHVELGISGRYEFRCCRSRGHNDIISCTTLLYISVNCVKLRACLLCLRSNPIENLCVACVCLLFLNEKNCLATGEDESQQFLLYYYMYMLMSATRSTRGYYGLSILNYIPIPLYSPYQPDGHVKLIFQSVSFVTSRARACISSGFFATRIPCTCII